MRYAKILTQIHYTNRLKFSYVNYLDKIFYKTE